VNADMTRPMWAERLHTDSSSGALWQANHYAIPFAPRHTYQFLAPGPNGEPPAFIYQAAAPTGHDYNALLPGAPVDRPPVAWRTW